MLRVSKFNAMLSLKCPQCRQGNMFRAGAFSKDFAEMEKPCKNCGYDYMIEPGFFIGATYVSYAFTVALLFATSISLKLLLGEPEVWMYMTAVTASVILFITIIFRLSRSIYIHLFGGVEYDKE